MGEIFQSPFIVPVAGCLVGVVAIVAGAFSQAHARRVRAEQRMAMLARGISLAEIETVLNPTRGERDGSDPMRRLARTRATALILMAIGVASSAFFVALAVILHDHDVLAGAALGLIPFGIGVGFLIDYNLQKRDLERFGREMDGAR